MNVWSHVSHLLWREAESYPGQAPVPVTGEATGAPSYMRKAVRFTMMGCAATMLTAQVVGIHLAAPVDAASPYGTCNKQCTDAEKVCKDGCQGLNGQTTPTRAECNKTCTDQKQACKDQCTAN